MCRIGDLALLDDSDPAFIVGLGVFLAGHACYATAFAKTGGLAGLKRRPSAAIPAAALMAVGASAILPRAGALKIPVAGYIGVISTMAALAAGTGRRDAVVGAGLFALSDLLLGLAKFRESPVSPGFTDAAVMALYTAGQAYIMRALTGSRPGVGAGT